MRTAALLLLQVAAASGAGPLSWDEAHVQAVETVKQLTQAEKYSLMRGIGWPLPSGTPYRWWYVGNIPAVQRLGIPSLNMQDAAQGWRTNQEEYVGTVTCWPSLLSMAATWDVDVVRRFAVALGAEFAGKGANVILGPSVNVNRVARNGRNFEYLSGEDPYLGARLTEQYVAGVQSQGVATVMKHYAFNQQETNRQPSGDTPSESNTIDEKTKWELYYPPYQAAVDAGSVAAICAYGKVDGVYACESEQLLKKDLKQGMGFRGFVMSDWGYDDWNAGSGRSAAVPNGLDMYMPMGNTTVFSPDDLSKVDVDDSVTRILAAMYRMRLPNSTKCTPPNCEAWLRKDVTAGHAAVARESATHAVVLLKNDGVLPLSAATAKTIAVIGSAADAQPLDPNAPNATWQTSGYYSGGGSGHVTAGNGTAVSPLAGIRARAAAAGVAVTASPTDDPAAAAAAAAAADVAIVVAGATSSEGDDRASLDLDHGADALIAAVAAKAKRTVVLMMVPGAVLTPWRDSAAAIAVLFLGGQETGAAFAAVLFGDHSPTGRLPIMLPATIADTIEPSLAPTITYSEGLATSYRNKNVTAAFPFGHGLTYTTFSYGKLTQQVWGSAGSAACVDVTLTNTGGRAARELAQLYLEFPAVAAQPSPVLKGFQRTALVQPGATARLTFCLSDRDMSYRSGGGWVKVGNAVAHVGASSADIRRSLAITAH